MDITVTTGPGQVGLKLPTDKGEASLVLPHDGAARLAFILLHHAAEAAAKADGPVVLEPNERRVTPSPIQISETGLAPDGSVVLKCEAQGGLTFHLAVAAEAVRSLTGLVAGLVPFAPATRQ